MTAALTELEALNLVTREIDPNHRRRKIVMITRSGSTTLRELDAVLDGIQQELLAPLSPTQQKQFAVIMARLTDQ